MMVSITNNATLYCSFAPVKATLGHSDGALIVPDDRIEWSGPRESSSSAPPPRFSSSTRHG